MDCPPNIHTCIDVLSTAVVERSTAVEMPICLGTWMPISTEGNNVGAGSYGEVFLVRATRDGVVASVMLGGQLVAIIRPPDVRAWQCAADRPETTS